MSTRPARACQITTEQLHRLDLACTPIRRAFGTPPYLTGTAGLGAGDKGGDPGGGYRDVDVRLILDDQAFARTCPDLARWELWCLAITAYLRDFTGLPVDFQIQRIAEANERFTGPRNPLGMGRTFAGSGDGTPEPETWAALAARHNPPPEGTTV